MDAVESGKEDVRANESWANLSNAAQCRVSDNLVQWAAPSNGLTNTLSLQQPIPPVQLVTITELKETPSAKVQTAAKQTALQQEMDTSSLQGSVKTNV